MPNQTVNYAGLSGPVSSLNTAATTGTIKPVTKKAGIDPAGITPLRKHGKKKPTAPKQNAIYQKGLTSLQAYNALLEPTQALMAAAAQGDLEQFKSLAPGYVEAITTADPMQARVRSTLNEGALAEMALGSRLDPVELRRVQQYSRMNRTGGGFGQGSENDLFNEALDVTTRGRELYDRRFNNLMNVGRFNQAAVGDPLMAVTGRPSGVAGLGDVPQDARNLQLEAERERANRQAAVDANRNALYGAGISAVGSIAGGAVSKI